MLQVFYVDVAKVDLDVVMLHMLFMCCEIFIWMLRFQ